MYRLESKVRYSEADKNSRLSYYNLLNYFQDISTLHSEELGESAAKLRGEGMAWILSFWQICIDEMPVLSEDIAAETWPYSTGGVFGLRNFRLTKKDILGKEKICAWANSYWALMDVETGRPLRIPEEVAAHYPDEPKMDMDYCDRKISIPKDFEEKLPVVVEPYFLDSNQHMNNAKYVMVAEGYLPEDFEVSEIRVEYKKAAVCKESLYPRVTREKNQVVVVLADDKGKPYAVVLFKSK